MSHRVIKLIHNHLVDQNILTLNLQLSLLPALNRNFPHRPEQPVRRLRKRLHPSASQTFLQLSCHLAQLASYLISLIHQKLNIRRRLPHPHDQLNNLLSQTVERSKPVHFLGSPGTFPVVGRLLRAPSRSLPLPVGQQSNLQKTPLVEILSPLAHIAQQRHLVQQIVQKLPHPFLVLF